MSDRHIRFVDSFEDLVATPFAGDVNALCWRRELRGDFNEIVERLRDADGMATVADEALRALDLSPAGAAARDVLLADLGLLRDRGLVPSLDIITAYPRDDADCPVPTDVYSFHVDRAPVAADTFLCTYAGACSEGLDNEAAIRRIDVPETRARLLAMFGGPDDAGFAGWLAEHSFDLHYAPRPGAQPHAFGVGNLWRIAISYPDAPVPPCIHRAPSTPPGADPRLLLIS